MIVDKIVIKGYKSIESCEIYLNDINVIIGANGAGKSNFISVFIMLQNIFDASFQSFVSKNGGPDSLLHFGRKHNDNICVEISFGSNGYGFSLTPTSDNRMMFYEEWFLWNRSGKKQLGSGHFESLQDKGTGTGIDKYVQPTIKAWRVYHFHDTGVTARVKGLCEINDNMFLRPDASNLAAFLYRLKETENETYKRIVKTVKLVAPFFDDFILRTNLFNSNKIELEWQETDSDIPFKAMHLSDGTLRFICLATALLQPENLQPDTILIDEPELGLHPFAITVLASLIKSVSTREKQVIVSTQSIELLNEFDVANVVVTDRESNASVFRRLEEKHLQAWLKDYSLGELWEKNLLGGRPSK